jgi:hypothetical protein
MPKTTDFIKILGFVFFGMTEMREPFQRLQNLPAAKT